MPSLHLSIDRGAGRVSSHRRGRRPLLVLGMVCLLAQVLLAQESSRKVISKTIPVYPALARQMHLNGKVKLEIIVAPNGSVTSAKLVGGSPVFELNAVEAVKKWKFERSAKETRGTIVLEFKND